jgi:ATPase family associated with various cellular activities (AAA)
MGNYAATRQDLDELVASRTPVVCLRSTEQARAMRLIKDVATSTSRLNLPFWIYTRATGLRDLRTNASVTDDRSLTGALEFAAMQFTTRAHANVVLVDPGDLSADSDLTRHLSELARLADANSGSILMLTDTPVWSQLQRQGMGLTLDLPEADEMYELVVSTLRDQAEVVTILWTEQDARRASEYLVGVSENEAVNLLSKTVVSKAIAKQPVDSDDVLKLAAYKDQIFGDLAGLERVHLKNSDFSVGGLTNLRAWLKRKHQLIGADLRGTSLHPPRGVLLVGVPGCGKSLSAKAIAAEWSLPLYRLDFASIMGQWVGQSESRMREALESADRVSPCVLWIDEIEKGLAGQNSSTGVERRLIGQFLFWLQESTSRVFIVATANDVRSLPPELLRKGRFNEIFFVDLPDATDREEIIRMYYRRYVKTEPVPGLVEKLVAASDGFAGADIESALHDVGEEVLLNGGVESLSPDFVLDTFTNTVPLSRTNPEQIEDIRAWGRERAVPAGTAHAVPVTGTVGQGRRVLVLGDS